VEDNTRYEEVAYQSSDARTLAAIARDIEDLHQTAQRIQMRRAELAVVDNPWLMSAPMRAAALPAGIGERATVDNVYREPTPDNRNRVQRVTVRPVEDRYNEWESDRRRQQLTMGRSRAWKIGVTVTVLAGVSAIAVPIVLAIIYVDVIVATLTQILIAVAAAVGALLLLRLLMGMGGGGGGGSTFSGTFQGRMH
jgi:hypothetical protein